MVVGIHCVPGYSLNDPNNALPIVVRNLLNCAVPIFLTLSAYFMSKKNFRSKEDVFAFWRKYIPKVYVPCIIWSLPIFSLSIYYEGGVSIGAIVWMLLCGYSIYYFIALIIQYYLLLPLLIRLNSLKWVIISGIISFASVYIVKYQLPQLPMLLYGGPFVLWIVFYMLGIYLASQKGRYSIKYPIVIAVAAIALQYIEGQYIYSLGSNLNGLGIKPSAFLYSIAIILILLSSKVQQAYVTNHITDVIEKIGKISFGIYLIHCYFLIYIIPYLQINIWIGKWVLALLLSVAFIQCAKLILPAKFSTNILGFRG